MQQKFIHVLHFPTDENMGGDSFSQNESPNANQAGEDAKPTPKKEGFFAKMKKALQEWSNNDQRDQEIDDATP